MSPLACGPEYEVLSTVEDQGKAGSGATAGRDAEGGTAGINAEGGASEGAVAGAGGLITGGETFETGGATGGSGMGASGGFLAVVCSRHSDCPSQQICASGSCTPCMGSAMDCSQPCPAQQVRVATIRNGCAVCECAPPSECSKDADCAMGEVCYRGAQCEDDCGDDLDCCFGNHCGVPGCPLPIPSCNLAGCEGGNVCEPSCSESTCFCNGMVWLCSDTGEGIGGTSGTGAGGTGAIGGNDCQGQCVAP